jgi:hypothetical protein
MPGILNHKYFMGIEKKCIWISEVKTHSLPYYQFSKIERNINNVTTNRRDKLRSGDRWLDYGLFNGDNRNPAPIW